MKETIIHTSICHPPKMTNHTTHPPFKPTTFTDTFNHEFKKHYANRLETETHHRSELNVEIETTIESDNAHIITTADIVLYAPTGPKTIIDILINPHHTTLHTRPRTSPRTNERSQHPQYLPTRNHYVNLTQQRNTQTVPIRIQFQQMEHTLQIHCRRPRHRTPPLTPTPFCIHLSNHFICPHQPPI